MTMERAMKQKLLLTDIDGVWLEWFGAFERYMIGEGYSVTGKVHTRHDDMGSYFSIDNSEIYGLVEAFNSGNWQFGTLPPVEGAIEGVQKLVDEGYRFVGITSCSTHPQTVALRKANLYNIFGDVFEEVHCVDVGKSKETYLASYSPSFWIEDKAPAADLGLEFGHTCILIDQTWNADEVIDSRVKRCYGWGEIVDHILGG